MKKSILTIVVCLFGMVCFGQNAKDTTGAKTKMPDAKTILLSTNDANEIITQFGLSVADKLTKVQWEMVIELLNKSMQDAINKRVDEWIKRNNKK